MTPEEINDYFLGHPVKWNDTMPKGVVANSTPILFGKWPGVIKIKIVKDENGEFRASDDPENVEAIKELFSWLPETPE